jgi:predicted nicotinamide N-methyase
VRLPAEVTDSISSTSQSSKLLSRIHRRFPTVTETVRFGSVEIAFTRAANPNRVLSEVAAEEDRRERVNQVRNPEPLHLPYWAELWDSGGAIAQHLVDHLGSDLQSKNTLDLGCGQGLAGCVAAALGAHVLFADLEPPALLFAQLNAEAISNHVRTRQLNWRQDQLDESFDFIIGADILYERFDWDFLEHFWSRHLKGGGKIILGEPGRPTGDAFIGWIAERDWKCDIFQQKLTTKDKIVRILELHRKNLATP